ncbi:MAG: helix-turn-helix transcriptional regulator [Clostridia bacterium]|nr:helix-turn-helix transcriptional regulator [Clostridia bacterium]
MSAEKTEKMTSLLSCMHKIWEYGNTELAKGIFHSFCGLLSEYKQAEPIPNSSKFPIFDILKYIENHFSDNLTLKCLAAHFNYADTYFSSCFKAHLNMSLREYINRIRIGRANELIKQGMTKKQAAAACGYTSNNTFFRAYKKYHSKYIRDMEEV